MSMMKSMPAAGRPSLYSRLCRNVRAEIVFKKFYQYFDVVHADTPQLLERAHQLRYQVFCVEKSGYEDPAQHPDGLEMDQYDRDGRTSHALLIYKPLNRAIGSVRNIYPNYANLGSSFPVQSLCGSMQAHDAAYVRNGCELSRLCISDVARAEVRQHMSALEDKSALGFRHPVSSKIAMAIAPLGLIRGAFEMALKKDIMNCYGVMEQVHLSKLVRSGLIHRTLGPEVEYHGKRVPFMCNILETMDHASVHNRDIWNIVSVRGHNHKLAKALHHSQHVIRRAETRH